MLKKNKLPFFVVIFSLLFFIREGRCWSSFDYVVDNTFCRFQECCNDAYVPYDIDGLEYTLSHNLFGQPIVNDLVPILQGHKKSFSQTSGKNALAISFHGWPGGGKNYVTMFMANALYKNGMNSKYVKLYKGLSDFPDASKILFYKAKIVHEISEIVSKCSKALIIFDEVHHMHPGILDAVRPMIDHYDHMVNGVDYREAIFVFLTNTGGDEIAIVLQQLYSKGIPRKKAKSSHFQNAVRRAVFNDGGFKFAASVADHLIDHYIPFLPLEQSHVELCIRSELGEEGIYEPEATAVVKHVMDYIEFGPTEDRPIFSSSGCKQIKSKIPVAVALTKSTEHTEL